MIEKNIKKIKLFSSLHFEPIKASTVKTEVVLNTCYSNGRTSRGQIFSYVNDIEDENYEELARGMTTKSFTKNNDSSQLLDKQEFLELANDNRVTKLSTQNFYIPKDEKTAGAFLESKENSSFAIPVPDIPRLQSTESQFDWFKKILSSWYKIDYTAPQYKLLLGKYAQTPYSEVFCLLEERDDKGTPVGQENYMDYFSGAKLYNANINLVRVNHNINHEGFYVSLAWFVVLNHFMSLDNKKKSLKEAIAEETFVKEVKEQFGNLCFTRNEHTDLLKYTIFSNQSTPLGFDNISYSVKPRDIMLDLTGEDIHHIFSAVKYKEKDIRASPTEKILYEKLFLKFTNKDRGKSERIKQWVKDAKTKEDDLKGKINFENIEDCLVYVESKHISKLFEAISLEDDNVELKNNPIDSAMSLGVTKGFKSYRNNYGNEKISPLVDILNELGKDFVLHDMKLSHLFTLVEIFGYHATTLSSKFNHDWAGVLIRNALKNYGDNTEAKHTALELLYRLTKEVCNVKLSLNQTKDKVLYETFSTDFPINITLDVVGVKYSVPGNSSGRAANQIKYDNLIKVHKYGF